MSYHGRIHAALLAFGLGLAMVGSGPALAADADADAESGAAAVPVVDDAEAEAIDRARDAITISGGWTRATPGNATNAAIYLRVGNSGATPEQLIGVRGEMAERVEFHNAQMQASTSMTVPAEDALLFEPNGNHIMLIDLRAPLREGDRFLLQLEFATGGSQTTSIEVLPVDAMGPAAAAAAASTDITSGATDAQP